MDVTQLVLTIAAGVGVLVYLALWLNNFQVKKYYGRVAEQLQDCRIEPPGFINRGKVKGQYKDRIVEWSYSSGYDRNRSIIIEAKMRLEDYSLPSDRPVHLEDNISFEKGWMIYSEETGTFDAKKVPWILEELYQAPEKYKKELVFPCLECGTEISGDSDKCPKCGWTWNQPLGPSVEDEPKLFEPPARY